MIERLALMWAHLECKVINPAGRDRKVVDKHGDKVIDGGYQNELQYLQIYHPEIINK